MTDCTGKHTGYIRLNFSTFTHVYAILRLRTVFIHQRIKRWENKKGAKLARQKTQAEIPLKYISHIKGPTID